MRIKMKNPKQLVHDMIGKNKEIDCPFGCNTKLQYNEKKNILECPQCGGSIHPQTK